MFQAVNSYTDLRRVPVDSLQQPSRKPVAFYRDGPAQGTLHEAAMVQQQQPRWEMAMETANVAAIAPSFEKLAIRLSAIGELAAAVNDALDLSAIIKAVRKHGPLGARLQRL